MKDKVTVICVYWCGEFRGREYIYRPEWVLKLRNMVKHNLDRPHDFICLTNSIYDIWNLDGDIITRPLIKDWPGWWSKIEIFRPDLFLGKALYLDLDTIVMKNLDQFFDLSGEMRICKAFGKASGRPRVVHGYNSSVMTLSDTVKWPWEIFKRNPEKLMKELRGDQDFLMSRDSTIKTFPSHWVTKYRNLPDGRYNDISKVILCMPWKNDKLSIKEKWVDKAWNQS